MELKIKNGDYVAGTGRLETLSGSDALLQRVLYRLTAKRGTFPFWETLGSRLYTLGSVKKSQRAAAAKQFVSEALLEEPEISRMGVSYSESEGEALGKVRVSLVYKGESLALETEIR